MLRTMLPIARVTGIVLSPPCARAEEKLSLKSVRIGQPTSDRAFPDGPGSDAANDNCLTDHSSKMEMN